MSATAPTTSATGVLPPRRHTGRVWWFCPDRGFGWALDDAGQAWFISWNELPGDGFRCLDDGLAITFSASRDRHGPVARQVALAQPARLAG